MKFTQQIKDNWLANLKSGKYKQGFTGLVVNKNGENLDKDFKHYGKGEYKPYYCCIGVLGDCTEGLNNYEEDDTYPYAFLKKSIGAKEMEKIYEANDNHNTRPKERDYSNVLPLIEALPVQD